MTESTTARPARKRSTSASTKKASSTPTKKASAKASPAKVSPRLAPVDVFASAPWYLDHMLPGFLGLPDEMRGTVVVTPLAEARARAMLPEGVEPVVVDVVDVLERSEAPVLVGAFGDLVKIRKVRERVLYTEHGMGLSYGNGHGSYPGADDRQGVEAIFSPNERAAALDRGKHPDLPVYVVGTPKLDTLKPRGVQGRAVVVSFHWDCKVSPETRSSFSHYKHEMLNLSRVKDFQVYGHAHPRPQWQRIVRAHFERFGIPFIENFEEALDVADVYVVDNSSTLYEAAAAGRPTVALNAPWYRQGLRNRVRFYDLIPGPQVHLPHQLIPTVRSLLDAPETWETQRAEVVREIYPHLGKATEIFRDALVEHLTKHPSPQG